MPKNKLQFPPLGQTEGDITSNRSRYSAIENRSKSNTAFTTGSIGKTNFTELMVQMSRHEGLVIGTLPQRLLNKDSRGLVAKWCERVDFDQMAEDLQGGKNGLERLKKLHIKAARSPKSRPISPADGAPTVLYLFDATQALERECQCKEFLFARLMGSFAKNKRNLMILFDIEAGDPNFFDLTKNSENAVIYHVGLNSDFEFLDETLPANNDDVEVKVTQRDAPSNMVEQSTPAVEDDGAGFGVFSNADEADKFEAKVEGIQSQLRAKALDIIRRHENYSTSEMKLKLVEPGYRQSRLGKFISEAQEDIQVPGIQEDEIGAFAFITFQEMWSAISDFTETGFDPEIMDRIKHLKDISPLPLGIPEEYDKKRDKNIVAYVGRIFGDWIDPNFGMIDADWLNHLKPGLGKAAAAGLRTMKHKANAGENLEGEIQLPFSFPEAWKAQENRELHKQGFLSPETLRKKKERELQRLRRSSAAE